MPQQNTLVAKNGESEFSVGLLKFPQMDAWKLIFLIFLHLTPTLSARSEMISSKLLLKNQPKAPFIGLTCYTCPYGASSNAECNKKAVDLPCEKTARFCKNRHFMAANKTVFLDKTCSDTCHYNGCIAYANATTVSKSADY